MGDNQLKQYLNLKYKCSIHEFNGPILDLCAPTGHLISKNKPTFPTTRVPQVPSCPPRGGLVQGWGGSLCWGVQRFQMFKVLCLETKRFYCLISKLPFDGFWKILCPRSSYSKMYQTDPQDLSVPVFSIFSKCWNSRTFEMSKTILTNIFGAFSNYLPYLGVSKNEWYWFCELWTRPQIPKSQRVPTSQRAPTIQCGCRGGNRF